MVKYVPIQLIQHSLKENITKPLRLYIYLKNESRNGMVKYTDIVSQKTLTYLAISKRTSYRHLAILIGLNWVNKDIHGNLFLRSWKRLEITTGLRFTSKVEFHQNYIIKDAFLGYFMGAVISYQCKLKKHIEWKERKKGGSLPILDLQYPISISYLSNLLKIPASTVQSYKILAIENGFVIRIKKNERVKIINKNLNIRELRKNWAENSFPIYHKGSLIIVHPDNFKPCLRFKRYR
ncbi:hypothetical protein [Winogradskyella sp.]|jgi:hypothetical protein|uniref:hypothetical protein n=1 Tax=Winogradskyella sp. TaxID=1883156 RepID=UPI0025EE874D|nr:hypothetical protein [Winogradskyella sp.]MCT4628810.1 hypothetical protein [Winogradskyella sp.]